MNKQAKISKKTLKAIQRKLIKQKKEIIQPKLEWIMRTSCICFVTPKIHIFPLQWQDPVTQHLYIELVICTVNDNLNYMELV